MAETVKSLKGHKSMRIEYLTEGLPGQVYLPTSTERSAYAQELIASGQAIVHLEPKFNTPELSSRITQAILVTPWAVAAPGLGNELPLQASSAHRTSPATILLDTDIPGTFERVDIVAKPTWEAKKANKELENLRQALQEGIPVVEPLGVVVSPESKYKALLLTIMRKGIVPLASINLEGLKLTEGDLKVKNLLYGLGAFVAEFQDKGFFHRDLHPGNIGLNITDESTKSYTLFDLENAGWVRSDKLSRMRKNNVSYKKIITGDPISTEVYFMGDAAKLLAGMVIFNPGIKENFLKSSFIQGYFENRRLFGGHTYPKTIEKFEQLYQETLKKQRVTINRINASRTPSATQK